MSPIELTAMCDRAVQARTREIIRFLRGLTADPSGQIARVAAVIEREFLGDEIHPAVRLVPVEVGPDPVEEAAEHGRSP